MPLIYEAMLNIFIEFQFEQVFRTVEYLQGGAREFGSTIARVQRCSHFEDGGLMVMDPVCGMDVDEDSNERASFQRKVYYFCSRECRVEFQESPADFIDDGAYETTEA